MRLARRALIASLLASPSVVRAQDALATLRELARQATIYLFPVYEMYRMRWQATVDESNPLRQKLNRFLHIPVLADHRARLVTTPNADTLYSSAWLDLAIEPLFLTVPPVGNHYYSYAFLDLFSDTFARVSHRLHGGEPRPHMIVGPAWQGDASFEVELVRAPTNAVWLLGRVLVDEPGALDRVRTLQARVLLETPDMRNERRILETRELMRQRTFAPAEPVADWPAPNRNDPFDLFEVGMRALGEGPLGERDKAVLESLAPLKLRPGRKFDQRAFGERERNALLAGIEQGHAEIRAAGRRFGLTIDGWSYGERHIGNFGDDHLYRAYIALTGLGTLEPAEAVYMTCGVDAAGRTLSGAGRYTVTFPPGGLPPVHAFWSLTVYEVTPEGRAFLVDNPIGRHAVGDRTPDLLSDTDGSLTIHLQRDRPTEARAAANWLPAPAGPLRLVLRAYEPEDVILEGRYRVPAVRRME